MVKDGRHRTRAITDGNEISISCNKSAFNLVSKIQDEVHRYTISFQNAKHKKAALELSLMQIEGVGKARASALLSEFKTIKAIKEASVDEIAKVKGFSASLAQNVKNFFESEQTPLLLYCQCPRTVKKLLV